MDEKFLMSKKTIFIKFVKINEINMLTQYFYNFSVFSQILTTKNREFTIYKIVIKTADSINKCTFGIQLYIVLELSEQFKLEYKSIVR